MTHVFPCTDCGAPTSTKLRKPKRCAPCAKAEALDYSRWNYRAHRDELLAYHRKRYAENRELILAQRAAKRTARERTCLSATPSTGDGTTPPGAIRLFRPAFHHYPRALAQRDPRCWPARDRRPTLLPIWAFPLNDHARRTRAALSSRHLSTSTPKANAPPAQRKPLGLRG